MSDLLSLTLVPRKNFHDLYECFSLDQVDFELHATISVVLKGLRGRALGNLFHDLGEAFFRVFLVATAELIRQHHFVLERYESLDIALKVVIGVFLPEDTRITLFDNNIGRNNRLILSFLVAVALPAADFA